MSLSRKRRKELKKLRSSAEELWGNQQVVIDHAAHIAREASRQLGAVGREEVLPRVQSGYEHYIAPSVSRAGQLARSAGSRIEHDVLPGVGKWLGTGLSVGDVAREQRVRRALARISPALAPEPKKRVGVGTVIGLGALAALIGALGYATYQTFRADDELWVADESDLDTN